MVKSNKLHKEKKHPISRSKGDVIFDVIVFTILTLALIIVAYPLYFIIISSFSSPAAVAGGKVMWYPIGINLDGYKAVFEERNVVRSFFNSILYTVVGTSVNIAVTIPTAYALSRKDFYGRGAITIFYMITMFINGGMIPTYLVVQKTGLMNTMWSLVLPGAISVYNLIVARTFFESTVPIELLEAAKLDGAGNTRFFFQIALPISTSIIAIMVLYYGVNHWNAYFSSLLYITSQEKYPLQLVLRTILVQNQASRQETAASAAQVLDMDKKRQTAELMKYSLIVISSIPVMILYPFVQKHFVKGVMIGSVKG